MNIPREKMAKLFATIGDPDQTPQNAASDLGLHTLPVILLLWKCLDSPGFPTPRIV